MRIKAAVAEQGTEYVVRDVELVDEVKPNDVLVKLVASGLCRSDYSLRHSGLPSYPVILGHEGSGIVVKVGENVNEVQPGDHVLLSYAYCDECKQCTHGHPSACKHWGPYNFGGRNKEGEYIFKDENNEGISGFYNQSSFATYSLTDKTNIIKVDKDLDLRLLGPLSCGFTTGSGAVLSSLKAKVGESFAVYGTGAVGFAAIMAAKIAGCYPIVAIDINDKRLAQARELGATHTFNNSEGDPKEFLLQLTDGDGIDNVVDTTGITKVMKDAIDSLSAYGGLAALAVTNNNIEFNPSDLNAKNKRIYGSIMGDDIPQYYIPKLIQFYRNGQFPFDKLVKFFDFEDINEAEKASISGNVVKPVVIMDKDYKPQSL